MLVSMFGISRGDFNPRKPSSSDEKKSYESNARFLEHACEVGFKAAVLC